MKLEINNKPVEAKSGETILSVCTKNGIKVPTLCYMPNLFPSGACRMCIVELEEEGRLVPSCAMEVRENMRIKTHSPRVLKARKVILELLLANHPDDCLYCEKTGQCELQNLTEELGINERRFSEKKQVTELDNSNVSLVRDPSKCILCGRCVRVCEETQSVSAIDFIGRGSQTLVGPAFKQGLNLSTCVNCGQCINVCPTGALYERNNIKEVLNAINNPDKMVVVQHAPAISVTLGEYFNFKTGTDVNSILNAAFRKIGFDRVFDTSFSADLTIMEEGSELVERINNNGKLPLLTSCSPGWIKFVEQFYPDFIDNLSTCKSPQQMMGAIIKSYFAEKEKIDPAKIFSVSIMPCTAKKFEAQREEMGNNGIPDIDVSLTTRELAKILKILNIDLNTLEPQEADLPFGDRSSAGKIFGVTGGVMEAALRTAHRLITGEELGKNEIKAIRNLNGIKEATVKIADLELNVAVANGLANARKVLDDMKNGRKEYHFIEIMTCPGGCIGGGGQPFGIDPEKLTARMKALYQIDKNAEVRKSHENKSVQKLYAEFLEKPLSHKSHKLLHTHYTHRKDIY